MDVHISICIDGVYFCYIIAVTVLIRLLFGILPVSCRLSCLLSVTDLIYPMLYLDRVIAELWFQFINGIKYPIEILLIQRICSTLYRSTISRWLSLCYVFFPQVSLIPIKYSLWCHTHQGIPRNLWLLLLLLE